MMNPEVVFLARRRSPLLWAWTEVRAAAVGVVTTLLMEDLERDPSTAGRGLGESLDEAAEVFELEERLDRGGRDLTWNELLALLAKARGVASVEPDRLILPPVALPIGGQALGFWAALLEGVTKTRRAARRNETLARFDERASIRTVLETEPGPMASSWLGRDSDVLLDRARGRVFDDLKKQLPPRLSRQLTRAYRRDYLAGAAAWMIEKIPSYPELLQRGARAELDEQEKQLDSIRSRFEEVNDPEDTPRLGT